jgi:hypothetical protein
MGVQARQRLHEHLACGVFGGLPRVQPVVAELVNGFDIGSIQCRKRPPVLFCKFNEKDIIVRSCSRCSWNCVESLTVYIEPC